MECLRPPVQPGDSQLPPDDDDEENDALAIAERAVEKASASLPRSGPRGRFGLDFRRERLRLCTSTIWSKAYVTS